MDREKIEKAVRLFLEGIGEDPGRPELKETPARVSRMCREIFAGIGCRPESEMEVVFIEEYDELVMLRDIPFTSVCEHHLLPFSGHAHIAYLPKDRRITGLSKLGRLVECASRRLQLQERLASEIAEAIMNTLQPRGVMVVIEAEHLCMTMRGVRKPGTRAVTSVMRGIFREDARTRNEVLGLLNQPRH